MVNKADIRAIKTAKSIKEAFFTLLEQKEFEEITVQDILDEALINRTTFYKHYANKNILAKALVEELKQRVFYPILEQRFSEPSLQFAQKAAPQIIEHKKKIRLLWKIETPQIHLKQDMYEMIKQRYIQILSKEALPEFIDLEYQGHMYASLGLATLGFIITHNQDLNPIDILKNLELLFNRIV